MSLTQWQDNGWLRPHATSPEEIGNLLAMDAEYLDACRTKRNRVEYDYVGGASDDDVRELLAFTEELRDQVLKWLRARHPALMPRSP